MLDSTQVGDAKKWKRDEPADSRLRQARIRKGMTQARLAELAHMHPNSIKNLENGTTREVTAGNAAAIAKALKTPVEDLGLRVRSGAPAPSIRMRQITPEQRELLHDILSLSEEQYVALRAALKRILARKGKKT
jgi:transcriptional regulator with XRE-family HTH domain